MSKLEKMAEKSPKAKRGHYSVYQYEAGDSSKKTRLKHNLSHAEMHHELKTNPAYRGTDKHGFAGGRTYPRKK